MDPACPDGMILYLKLENIPKHLKFMLELKLVIGLTGHIVWARRSCRIVDRTAVVPQISGRVLSRKISVRFAVVYGLHDVYPRTDLGGLSSYP